MTERTRNQLARRTPENQLDRAEDWADLSEDDRKRRAARALQADDEPALWSLVESHLLTFGRKGLRVSTNTLLQYRRGLRVVLAWTREHATKPHQLSRQDALRFVRSMEAAGSSPATVNARLSGARATMQALLWAGMMPGDPFAGVSVTDPTPAVEKRERYADAELGYLLEEADPREAVVVLLGADAGLRASELVSLTWADVDLPALTLVVRAGKGGKRRTVAMTERLGEALVALGIGGSEERVVAVTRQRLHAIVAALCRRAGVEARGIHSLRHSCGTRLHRATKDLVLTARHLGHASTGPTELYAKLDDADYRAGVAALGNGIGPAALVMI